MRGLLLCILLFLSACSPAQENTSTPAAQAPESSNALVGPPVPAAERPAWQTLPLTNARTGETFTFADFAGQTVFVEPMATWCTNCRQQLGHVRSAREQLGDSVVFIALSVETNIASADLASYADDQGFDWQFAVLTPELLGELVNTFGRTISNPPSTPHFILRPDGTTTTLFTGIKSPDEIIAQVQAANGA